MNRQRLEGMACGIVIGNFALWTALPLGYTTPKLNFWTTKECGHINVPSAQVFGRVVASTGGYKSCGPF